MQEQEQGQTGLPWTRFEVEAAVSSYFQMLRLELLGQQFNKAQRNRDLQAIIPARNRSSIEQKHRNISAVLVEMGVMPLSGYKPLYNYQGVLVEVVADALAQDRMLDVAAIQRVETPAEQPPLSTLDGFVVEVPVLPRLTVAERKKWSERVPVKRDYLVREAANRSLGLAGELLVMEYEARRLHEAGQRGLADRIEHTSHARGDGAGYDILSYDLDGRERFIEVKTTAFLAETPFFVSTNEVEFSAHRSEAFHLYRLFDFRKRPRMFILPGAMNSTCLLDPMSYRATVLGTK
jgi:hypothetical protein